jgi:hypothetical protein
MASGTSPKKDKVILLLKQGETSPTSIANKVGYAVSYARLVKNEFSSVSGSLMGLFLCPAIHPTITLHNSRLYQWAHCDVMCKTGRETGTRSTMSDNQQTAHCVDVSLTARSLSVLSVSLSKGETSVENPGDDKGCHLELKRSGRQQHCDSTSRSIIA